MGIHTAPCIFLCNAGFSNSPHPLSWINTSTLTPAANGDDTIVSSDEPVVHYHRL